jgi:hypothetical protein
MQLHLTQNEALGMLLVALQSPEGDDAFEGAIAMAEQSYMQGDYSKMVDYLASVKLASQPSA